MSSTLGVATTGSPAIFLPGSETRLTVSFVDQSNTPADPTAVTLTITQPDGSTVTESTLPPIVKDSVGNYHYDFTVVQTGIHSYVWTGTGTIVAAVQSAFTGAALLEPASGAQGLATQIMLCNVDQVRDWINQDGNTQIAANAANDIKLARLIISASTWWLE